MGGTPSSKRKLPLESAHSFGFSNKKRRSVKKSLGMELLPNTLFSGTPSSGKADHDDHDDDDVFNHQINISSSTVSLLGQMLQCFLPYISSSFQCLRSSGLLSEYLITGWENEKATSNLCEEEEPAPCQPTRHQQVRPHSLLLLTCGSTDPNAERDATQTTWIHLNLYPLCFSRVESGRTGCFSPKVSKKEAPRKSLRLRFSLGKSSKDAVSVDAR